MSVPSTSFLILAALSACLFNMSRAIMWRQVVLLLTNVLFLASFVRDPFELLPYAGFLAMGFTLIRLLQRGVMHWLHVMAVTTVVVAFFWLKQYTFLPQAVFLNSSYLLVGLSYVFFRVLHLVIDMRHPEDTPPINLFDYLNFTLNFTSLTSGPIQRYEDYRRTAIDAPLELKFTDMGVGCERIVTGLFKILVVAVLLSVLQRDLAARLTADAPWLVRMLSGMGMAALYPVYLYFNFSGYTDFVIGIARFFRIELPENFDRPFTAASFIEYWSRWHMSLSNWLKTYVYNPLMTTIMRRVGNPKALAWTSVAALFVTFFLIGAWHGRTSKFLFFGLLNGCGVAANQAYRMMLTNSLGRKRFIRFAQSPAYLFAGRGLTFAWVSITLLWFWSDWPQLSDFAQAMGIEAMLVGGWVLIIGAALLLSALIGLRTLAFMPTLSGRSLITSRYVRTVWISVMVALLIAVQGVMNAAPPDIVYKDF